MPEGNQAYEDTPKVCCVYSNKDDPRGCVFGRDICGQKTAVANLAHSKGQVYCVLAIIVIAGVAVGGYFLRGGDRGKLRRMDETNDVALSDSDRTSRLFDWVFNEE